MTAWRHPGILDIEDFRPEGRWALLGPNGAGKTTLIRLMAGTLPSAAGLDATYLPQRPHLFRGPVRLSLAIGLEPEEVARAVQLLDVFGFERERLEDPGPTLSGGERQRVALARVLARRSPLVLLDEPLAPFPASDRMHAATTIAQGIGTRDSVVVTHDLAELASMADKVAVLFDGRIRQQGPLAEVFASPADPEVAYLLGVSNILDGVVKTVGEGVVTAKVGEVEITGVGEVSEGDRCRVMFAAESVAVYQPGQPVIGSPRNHWPGVVISLRERGRMVDATIDIGVPVLASLTPGAVQALGIHQGLGVALELKATAIRVVGR